MAQVLMQRPGMLQRGGQALLKPAQNANSQACIPGEARQDTRL